MKWFDTAEKRRKKELRELEFSIYELERMIAYQETVAIQMAYNKAALAKAQLMHAVSRKAKLEADKGAKAARYHQPPPAPPLPGGYLD